MNNIIGITIPMDVIHIGADTRKFIYQNNETKRQSKATKNKKTKMETTTKPLRPVKNTDKHPMFTFCVFSLLTLLSTILIPLQVYHL